MGSIVTFAAPREVVITSTPDRPLADSEVRLETLYSGISAGTELTAYRGTNPYLSRRWNQTLRLFQTGEPESLRYPVEGWGYEEVGRVVELGSAVDDLAVGDVVYGTWGHRTHHVVDASYARGRRLAAGMDPLQGIFSQIGAIAVNGVHDARIRIGETVAVFGLGVLGQIVAQLAKRSGAYVVGIDPVRLRRETALRLGAADTLLDSAVDRPAEAVRDLTEGRGADVTIEVTGSSEALHEAIRTTAYSAKVVALGFFQGQAQGLRLGDEFHHNRINVVCSQIFGVDPELSYRWSQPRLVAAAMRMQASGMLDLLPLVSHVVPFADAATAFELLDTRPEEAIQVVLRTEAVT